VSTASRAPPLRSLPATATLRQVDFASEHRLGCAAQMAADSPSLIFVALKLILGALTCSYRPAPSTLPKPLLIPDLCPLGRLCLQRGWTPLREETLSQQSLMPVFTHGLLLLEL